MYNDTITLFNRLPSRTQGDKWFPVVLTGVDVNMDRASIIKAMGAEVSDSVSLHIRYSKDENGNILIGDRQYVLPKEYIKIAAENLPEYITFKSGNSFDFFYVGEWQDTEPINDDDYLKGFYDHMNSEYDNVFTISTVSGAYDLIPHFEILGK